MSGDTVDGFSGAKGIGSVTANKLLDKNGATWETVVKAYESKGQTEEDALINARLSYILRNKNEYNQKEGEITLWMPK
jgi:DNA polymerase-1